MVAKRDSGRGSGQLRSGLLSETVGLVYKAENKAGLQMVMDRVGGEEWECQQLCETKFGCKGESVVPAELCRVKEGFSWHFNKISETWESLNSNGWLLIGQRDWRCAGEPALGLRSDMQNEVMRVRRHETQTIVHGLDLTQKSSWPLNNTYVGPFIHEFVSVNIYSSVNVFVLPYDFLNIFISLTLS